MGLRAFLSERLAGAVKLSIAKISWIAFPHQKPIHRYNFTSAVIKHFMADQEQKFKPGK
jgi:hypothetical protein